MIKVQRMQSQIRKLQKALNWPYLSEYRELPQLNFEGVLKKIYSTLETRDELPYMIEDIEIAIKRHKKLLLIKFRKHLKMLKSYRKMEEIADALRCFAEINDLIIEKILIKRLCITSSS